MGAVKGIRPMLSRRWRVRRFALKLLGVHGVLSLLETEVSNLKRSVEHMQMNAGESERWKIESARQDKWHSEWNNIL